MSYIPSCKKLDRTYLKGEVLGLVRPDGRHAEDEILFAQIEVVTNRGRLDSSKSMVVDGTNEVSSHIDRILGQCLAILLQAGCGEIDRLGLVGIE